MNMKSRLFVAALAIATMAGVAIPASAGTIRLCTGGAAKPYAAVGDMIATFSTTAMKIVVVKDTGGTSGNIDRTLRLDVSDPTACDAMIGQPDGAVKLKREFPALASKLRKIGTAHREYLQVVCNKASGVDALTDIEGSDKYSVAVGAEGSGGSLIWDNFIFEDSGYDAVVVKNEGGTDALANVAAGTTTCALFPAGLHDGDVTDADKLFGEDLVLATATDKDFNDAVDPDGNSLYEFVDIPSDTYGENLQTGIFGSSVETVSWLATVYINLDRVSKDDITSFIKAVASGKKQAVAQFGG